MIHPKYNFLISILAVLFLVSYNPISANDSKKSAFEVQIKPIIWGSDDFSIKQNLADFKSGKREIHPLDIGKALVYTAYKYQQTGDSLYMKYSMGYLQLVEELHSNPTYFNNNTFKYNFSHENLEAGWWSGMANSAIIFGLTFCDDVYGTNHQPIIDSLIISIGTDFEKGGCLKTIDDGKSWILEYSWEGINENSVKYVLNGFLYSLTCLKLSSKISSNHDLDALYMEGLEGLKHKLDEYYFEGVKWTKYDLIPTIEPPHYAIFDIALLESLASLSNNTEDWIKDAISKRREILKNSYNLDILKEESGVYSILFSLIGPPHPYWIDVYPIEILIEYNDGDLETIDSYPPKDFEMDIYKRGFIDFTMDKSRFFEIKQISVISKYLGLEQQLFKYSLEELIKAIPYEDKELVIERGAITANYDGVLQDSIVKIEPERTFVNDIDSYKSVVAQIVVPFLEIENFQENSSIVLKVNSDIEVKDHKFFVVSTDGKSYQQFYKSIPKGENIIVLDLKDFEGSEDGIGLNKLIWQIYTSKMTCTGKVGIDAIFKAKTPEEVKKIKSNNSKVPRIVNLGPISATFDGFLQDSVVKIEPERVFIKGVESYKNSVAQIVIPFFETQDFNERGNIVLKVDNSVAIKSHKFFIYSETGGVYQRYYLPIPKGKNIMALNPVGFKNLNITDGIIKIVWQIYTDGMEEGEIAIDGIFKSENNFQLKSVFENKGYNFEEKVIRGNIY